jgi:hypothetical protein
MKATIRRNKLWTMLVLDSAKPSLYKTAPRNMIPTKLAPELCVADNDVGSTRVRNGKPR